MTFRKTSAVNYKNYSRLSNKNYTNNLFVPKIFTMIMLFKKMGNLDELFLSKVVCIFGKQYFLFNVRKKVKSAPLSFHIYHTLIINRRGVLVRSPKQCHNRLFAWFSTPFISNISRYSAMIYSHFYFLVRWTKWKYSSLCQFIVFFLQTKYIVT